MIKNQLERLKKDMRELENFEYRMELKQRTDVIKIILERKKFLEDHINQLKSIC